MLTPRTETERAVFDLWKELRPDEAFVLGVDECAGHLFIPTQARVESVLARISRIQKSTQNPIERKLLASYRASLELREPARLPQTLLESLFGYMIKEGVKANHMRTLATDGRKALDATRRRMRGPTAPGMRALVQLACSGLDEILKVVDGELRNKDARAAVQALVAANARYAKAFGLPGFSPAGPLAHLVDGKRRAPAVRGDRDGVCRRVRSRHPHGPLAGNLLGDDGRAERRATVPRRAAQPPRPRGVRPLRARLEFRDHDRGTTGPPEPHRLDVRLRLRGDRVPARTRIPPGPPGDCGRQALRIGRGFLCDRPRALGRHRSGLARVRVPLGALADRPVLAGHRGRPHQFGEAGHRPLRRVGSPHDGSGAGDGLLPTVPGPPDHRTGLRVDVRDHRRADPGVAAGRAETRQEPPGLQRVCELDRVASEDRLRGETRSVGPVRLNPATGLDRGSTESFRQASTIAARLPAGLRI